MLQEDEPHDLVIATGQQYSVRDFVSMSGQQLGIDIEFQGSGLGEVGIVRSVSGDDAPQVQSGDIIVRVDPHYFRPAEVDSLLGDASQARKLLDWEPEIDVQQLCAEMVRSDLDAAKRIALLKSKGYETTMPQGS